MEELVGEIWDIRLQYLLVVGGWEVPSILRANNNKEVNSVKKADKPSIVININVYGDNNKVSTNETRSHVPAAVIIIVLIAVAVLAVSFCCPELLPDFVRWIIGKVVNS